MDSPWISHLLISACSFIFIPVSKHQITNDKRIYFNFPEGSPSDLTWFPQIPQFPKVLQCIDSTKDICYRALVMNTYVTRILQNGVILYDV
ncbi:hypothetical protein CEXT_691421 [Caerostris extrusa]|uniref:Uncharacterized protein n=1 Tax=Caerostris extrusa TaxID=172846 RepID=A0AAV4ULF2_CAEEX|nr:hypothetical protein CEXT_691421 [Caerostris extrusa]